VIARGRAAGAGRGRRVNFLLKGGETRRSRPLWRQVEVIGRIRDYIEGLKITSRALENGELAERDVARLRGNRGGGGLARKSLTKNARFELVGEGDSRLGEGRGVPRE